MKKIISKISSILLIIAAIISLNKVYSIYKKYNINGLEKAEYNINQSKIYRDEKNKYNNKESYKIESTGFNDAVMYKEVKIKPNTLYKVSCYVKTEDIVSENNKETGAQICLLDTTEGSEIIQSEDWTKLEFVFNSKNRENAKIAFRLGTDEANCKGNAWFANLKFEESEKQPDNHWKIGCYIFKYLDVTIEDEKFSLQMSEDDIKSVEKNMQRFKTTCEQFSNYNMEIEYEINLIATPITSISYAEEYKYYIDANDFEHIIGDNIKNKEYDYVFCAVRMGDKNINKEIPINDWIGLGGMDYQGIGYSNIRMSNNPQSYTYIYDEEINTFPEEVYLHEFLHTLERISIENGYETEELHNHKLYGYEATQKEGLKDWYKYYMDTFIKKEVYTYKPAHNSDFKTVKNIEFIQEPENVFEEIKGILKIIKTEILNEET